MREIEKFEFGADNLDGVKFDSMTKSVRTSKTCCYDIDDFDEFLFFGEDEENEN